MPRDHTPAPAQLAGTDTERLSVLSPADVKWDNHKGQTERLAYAYRRIADRDEGYSALFSRHSARCSDCADFLGFGQVPDKETGEVRWRLRQASFCRVRYCPICSWRRSMLWTSRFLTAWPQLRNAYPSARFVLLTLTVCNCGPDELRKTLAAMNAGWKRMTERKTWPALGFLRGTEITRSPDGTAHPHFHALLMVRSSYFTHGYIKQDQWVATWRDCMRLDYTPIVDVRAVKPTDDDVGAAVREVVKYTTKLDEDQLDDVIAHPDFLRELALQTRKLRFMATGGTLRDVLRVDDEPTDQELAQIEPDKEAEPTADPLVPFLYTRRKLDPHYRRARSRDPHVSAEARLPRSTEAQ